MAEVVANLTLEVFVDSAPREWFKVNELCGRAMLAGYAAKRLANSFGIVRHLDVPIAAVLFRSSARGEGTITYHPSIVPDHVHQPSIFAVADLVLRRLKGSFRSRVYQGFGATDMNDLAASLWIEACLAMGCRIEIVNRMVRRDLNQDIGPFDVPGVTMTTPINLGLDTDQLFELYKHSREHSLIRDDNVIDLRSVFEHYLVVQKKRFDDPMFGWCIAAERGSPVGFAIASSMKWGGYIDGVGRKVGGLIDMGVVPESRGKRIGRMLHRFALLKMRTMGHKEYIGATDVLNNPQLWHFQSNNCSTIGDMTDISWQKNET